MVADAVFWHCDVGVGWLRRVSNPFAGDAILKPDNVNHPQHYTSHPSGVECIQITEHMNFCLGNAMKYLWRAGQKSGSPAREDLEKAIWYIQRELQRHESFRDDVDLPRVIR